jgi:Leucine-rich repeat (LRR) protein
MPCNTRQSYPKTLGILLILSLSSFNTVRSQDRGFQPIPHQPDIVARPSWLDSADIAEGIFGGYAESSLSSNVFYKVELHNKTLDEIASIEHLEYLYLMNVDLTKGIGSTCLANLQNLKRLRLIDCNIEISELLPNLSNCRKLERLSVWNDARQWPDDDPGFKNPVTVSEAKMTDFIEAAPKVQRLLLQSSERFEPAAITALTKLENLEKLIFLTERRLAEESLTPNERQIQEGIRLHEIFREYGLKSRRARLQLYGRWLKLPYAMIFVE